MASDKDVENWLNDHTNSVGVPQATASDADVEAWLNDKPGSANSPLSTAMKIAPILTGPGGPLETPWSKLSNAFPKMAGVQADLLGRATANPMVQRVTKYLTGLTPTPEMAAAASLPLSMVPQVATAAGMFQPASDIAGRAGEIVNAGERIGAAEKAAGIVTKAVDKYPTSGNVGEFLNTLESQLQNGTITTPQELQQAKDVIDYVWQNPRLVGKTNAITVQAARLSTAIRGALNAAVPGRAAPAADFATLMALKGAATTAGKVGGAIGAGATALSVLRRFLQRPPG